MKGISFKLAALFFSLFLLSAASAKADGRPNVVLIQTDDQSVSMMKSRYINNKDQRVPTMPNLEKLIASGGVSFTNHMATSPVCAPSRTALVSGRYPHTTRVVGNLGLYGGWEGWKNSTAYSNNFPIRLDQAGYHNAHFGKWTNFYGDNPTDSVPPGWDSWMSDATDESTRMYYGYEQLGRIERKGIDQRVGPLGNPNYSYMSRIDPKNCRPSVLFLNRCFYHTDRMTTLAGDEISYAAAERKPFYIQIDYHAPHGDKTSPVGPQPATRHLLSAEKTRLPKGRANKNYNERTDTNPTKPYLIRKDNGPITSGYETYPTSTWRRGIESMRSVDEGLGYLIDTLKEAGEYNNTYIIFTSDNGYFYGDHRFLAAKFLAYQESAQIPLVIAGPGVPRGATNIPSSTVDIGPTILDLVGVNHGSYQTDGTSLKNNIFSPVNYQVSSLNSPYSQRVQLIEYISDDEMAGNGNFNLIRPRPIRQIRPAGEAPPVKYRAIKIGRYKYVNYDRTTDELYDLATDPEEMKNQLRNPAYAQVLSFMRNQFEVYKNCQGSFCLNPPLSPLPKRK